MTIIAQRIGNPWSETVCSPMFCHDTRPRFSITHSRTLITTNRNNQFFESIYIADLSPTDNFHLIHPPYVSIHFAIDQWKWKRKHFHKYVFVISKYLSTLFYSVLYVHYYWQFNKIKFSPLYTIIVFLSSLEPLSWSSFLFSSLRKAFQWSVCQENC